MGLADLFLSSPAAQRAMEAFDEANRRRTEEVRRVLHALAKDASNEREKLDVVVGRHLDEVLDVAGHFAVVKHAAAVGGLGIVKDFVERLEARVRGPKPPP